MENGKREEEKKQKKNEMGKIIRDTEEKTEEKIGKRKIA